MFLIINYYKNFIGEEIDDLLINSVFKSGKKIKFSGTCVKCNKTRNVVACDLVNHRSYQCICNTRKYVHDENFLRLYNILHHMRDRCENPNCDAYKNYGAKGISVCNEWVNDFNSFKEWSINNGYKSNLTIDRINPKGDYEPSNCQWITLGENVARSNIDNPRRKRLL